MIKDPPRGKLQPTKTETPRVDHAWLRPQTIAALSRSRDRRLTVVCAPAGFGKTTTVAAFCTEIGARPIWYRLDVFDRDPMQLLNSLTEAFRRGWPDFEQRLPDEAQPGYDASASLERLLRKFVKECNECIMDDLLLVLDDYQEVADSHEANRLLDYILTNLPPSVHFILLTRYSPAFPISKLRLADDLNVIDISLLTFDVDQTSHLLHQRTGRHFAQEHVAHLVRLTEGWPAAIVLTSQALEWLDLESLENAVSDPRMQLDMYSYLAEQVYHMEDEDTKILLDRTCCLPYVTTRLSTIMLEAVASQAGLHTILNKNLFLMRARNNPTSYHYHRLFSDFLKDHYITKYGHDSLRTLMIASAAALESVGDEAMAVELLLNANEVHLALDLLSRCGEPGLDRFPTDSMSSWHSRLPWPIRNDHSWAHLLLAAASIRKGLLESALLSTQIAIRNCSAESGSSTMYAALSMQEHVLFWQGKHEQAILTCKEALTHASSDPERFHTLLSISSAAIDARDWATADAALEASREFEAGAPLSERLRARALVSLEAYTRGDFRKADSIGDEIRQEVNCPMLSAGIWNVLGLIAAGLGDRDRAYASFTKALATANVAGLALTARMVTDNLALLQSARGDHNEGWRLCEANSCAEASSYDPVIVAYGLHTKATILRRLNRIQESNDTHKEALILLSEHNDPLLSLEILSGLHFTEGLLVQGSASSLLHDSNEAKSRGLSYVSLQAKLYAAILYFDFDKAKSFGILTDILPSQLRFGHVDLLAQELCSRPEIACLALDAAASSDHHHDLLRSLATHWLFADVFVRLVEYKSSLVPLAFSAAATDSPQATLTRVLAVASAAPTSTGLAAAIDHVAAIRCPPTAVADEDRDIRTLSRRETEVLSLMAAGLRNPEIAARLFVSNATVKTHVNHIFTKLNVANRVEAVLRYRDRAG